MRPLGNRMLNLQGKTALFAVRIWLSQRRYYVDLSLNCFDHFKEGLFIYRKNGRYPIDNNLAERQVRPFTALRKAIQHYRSDAGAEMAAVYLSVVSTVNLAGQSVWRFPGTSLRIW